MFGWCSQTITGVGCVILWNGTRLSRLTFTFLGSRRVGVDVGAVPGVIFGVCSCCGVWLGEGAIFFVLPTAAGFESCSLELAASPQSGQDLEWLGLPVVSGW